MGKKTFHYMDFDALASVNKAVVALTKESHEFSVADGEKLSALIQEVEQRADNQEFEEAVAEKASLLVFKLASGQYFHAGNKRTALVAGFTFLIKNGYRLDIKSPDLVSAVDKAGMGSATLDDVYGLVKERLSKSPVERKGWDKAVAAAIDSHKAYLTGLAS